MKSRLRMFQGDIFVIMGKNLTTGFDKNHLCFISLKLHQGFHFDTTYSRPFPLSLHLVFEDFECGKSLPLRQLIHKHKFCIFYFFLADRGSHEKLQPFYPSWNHVHNATYFCFSYSHWLCFFFVLRNFDLWVSRRICEARERKRHKKVYPFRRFSVAPLLSQLRCHTSRPVPLISSVVRATVTSSAVPPRRSHLIPKRAARPARFPPWASPHFRRCVVPLYIFRFNI